MAQSRRDFRYQPPSYDEMADRAERRGSMFDSLFRDVKLYSPKQGLNVIRILPPTWKNNRGHYGLTLKVHFSVGAQDQQYLCLMDEHSPHERCPIDDALIGMGARATNEEKFQLRPGVRIAYYIIDRDNESEGLQVWVTSSQNDSEIASQAINRRNRSVLPIADPYDGYDVEFTRTGAGKKGTRYRGFQVSRESSPLSDSERRLDEWLDYIFENPLDSKLNFYSPEHIEKVFYGGRKESLTSRVERHDEPDDDYRETPRLRRMRDDPVDGPLASRRSRETDDDEQPEPRRNGDDRRSDPDEDRPRSARYRTAEPERSPEPDSDEVQPRSARRDRDADTADDRPTRAVRRDDPDDDRPARAERRARIDDDEGETVRARPPRTRLARDLDDDIPFERSRAANGDDRDSAAAAAVERDQRAARPAPRDDAETPSTRRGTARETIERDDDEDRPVRRGRERVDDADPDMARRDAMRVAMREKLNREA